ncbi:hypothetical protein Taro_005336 [Colocasia esculenta]|uniref:Uncharacterized protein n=1 Tax=Colocasia esculenta TaxID=4460 RepID=A0A843TMS9_COLES|nr:hypothetical protein [Colocasia esculenta]
MIHPDSGEGSTIADVDPNSYRVAIADSKAAAFCTLTSTIHRRNPSVSSQSQQLSRERAKLLPSDDDDSAHPDGIFRCFSAADLKSKMLARLIRTGHKQGQWSLHYSLLDSQITVAPQWLETGQMTIAFTPAHQHETDAGVVQHADSDRERGPWRFASPTPTSTPLIRFCVCVGQLHASYSGDDILRT